MQTSSLDPTSVSWVPFRSTRPTIIRRRAEVGDRIRGLRRWRKLSQQRLGELIGEKGEDKTLGRQSVSNIENGYGSITVDAALAIADILKVPAAWLFSDDWTWPSVGDWPDEPPPRRFP